MRNSQSILAFVLSIFLIGCNSIEHKFTPIQERILLPKTQLTPLFDSIRPLLQRYSISSDKDTLIIGKNGTIITLNKNTFVDEYGNVPSGTIDIKLIEINSWADAVKSNLQTTSNGEILQTAGMIFIDALSNGRPLNIAEGKNLFIETQSQNKDIRMKLFSGDFNKTEVINWLPLSKLEDKLIPIPLKLLNFKKGAWECWLSDKQLELLNNPKYENTFIATREFQDRAGAINFITCEQYGYLSQNVLDIYLNNTDKNLYYSDSLVVQLLLKTQKNKIDTLRKFEFDEIGWITWFYELCNDFKNQRLTRPIDFNKIGINESTTNDQLIKKGFSEFDAEKLLALFRTRKQIIKSIEDKTNTNRLASYSFSINKLGWFNVDVLLNITNLEETDFYVKIKSKDTLDYISVSLVIPSYRISLFSIDNKDNQYSFTKKKDGYRKLPVGESAIIIAFSYKDNKPYFGKTKIKIPKSGLIDLTLDLSSGTKIKEEIERLTN